MNYLELALIVFSAFVLVYVSITDIRERRIPNHIMFPALGIALAVALARPERWSLLLGGLIAGTLFLIPILTYGLGKAGGGDMKLGMFIGLVLGWPSIFLALLIAFVSAASFVVFGVALRRIKLRSVIAFGPFLAFGGIVTGALSLITL